MYPLIWSANDLKAPPKYKWSLAFHMDCLKDERFRRKFEREHPETRWDTQNIDDDNVDGFWWVAPPHPAYPRFMYHQRRALAKRSFPAIVDGKDGSRWTDCFLRDEYVRLSGEAVITLQKREGPFAYPENIENMPEHAEARAIWVEMAKRVKDREVK